MITTWILIIAMNVGGYGESSQKIEGIQSKEECSAMGNNFTEQMSRSKFACIPYTIHLDKLS